MRRSPPVHLHICPAGRLSPRDRTTSSWLRCMTMHRSESRRIAQTRGPAVGRSGRRSVLKSCVHPRTDHSVRYAPGGLPGDRSYRAERRFRFTLRVAECHDGEVVRLVTGPLRPAGRRAKLILADALPGGPAVPTVQGFAADLLGVAAMQGRRLRVTARSSHGARRSARRGCGRSARVIPVHAVLPDGPGPHRSRR